MTGAAQPDPRPSGWRPAGSRRLVAAGVGLALLLVAAAAVAARWGPGGQSAAPPVPAGLRLLVADAPAPFVLDVDTGTTRPVTGLPTGGDRSTHVETVGEHAVVVSRLGCRGSDCPANPDVHLVRHGETVATRLGAALDVEASRDGLGMWLLSRRDATRCVIGQVGLDGRQRRPARPAPCEAVLVEELPAGLLLYVTVPRNGGDPYSALVTAGGIRRLPVVVDGVAGGDLVLSTVEPGRLVALTDVGSGTSHRLPWPSRLEGHVMGEVGGHPDGRLAHVAFYPALDGADLTLDVWLLDVTTRRWRQLPGMPLRLAPVKPQLRWTADGRLLLLAGAVGEPAAVVATWRPGDRLVAVRQVRLPGPELPDGFRFAIW
jgi:hypothetical protein